MHSTAREAAAMATRAGAGTLACTHIARFANPVNILAEARTHFAGAVTVAQDGVTATAFETMSVRARQTRDVRSANPPLENMAVPAI
jgi:hypothetical protein